MYGTTRIAPSRASNVLASVGNRTGSGWLNQRKPAHPATPSVSRPTAANIKRTLVRRVTPVNRHVLGVHEREAERRTSMLPQAVSPGRTAPPGDYSPAIAESSPLCRSSMRRSTGLSRGMALARRARGGLRRASRLTSRDLSLGNDRDGLPTRRGRECFARGTACPQRRSDTVASATFLPPTSRALHTSTSSARHCSTSRAFPSSTSRACSPLVPRL